MNRNIIIVLAALSLLVVGVLAFAGQGGPVRGKGQVMCPGAASGPQLTAEQEKKLDGLSNEHRDKMTALHKKLLAKHGELETAINAEKPDQAKIDGLLKDVANIQVETYKERLAFRSKVKSETGLDMPFHGGFGSGGGCGNNRGCGGQGRGCGSGCPNT